MGNRHYRNYDNLYVGRKKPRRRRRRKQGLYIAAAVSIVLVIALMIGLLIKGISRGKESKEEVALAEPVISEEVVQEEETKEEEVTEEETEEKEETKELSPEVASFNPGYEVSGGNAKEIVNEEVISENALLIDVDSGEVIAKKASDTTISPASMTKILTVLVAAEHVDNLDDTFTITRDITDYAYSNDCSIVGFEVDEQVTVRDLLYGTILPSGADAGVALAEYVAGSHEAFVEMMNEKLSELGLSDTAHFTNCVGIYDEDHYCTLTDMAMILKAAVENDLAREVLSAHSYTTTATEQHPDGITISNWFLRRIEDKETNGEVMCAKTGFVNQSGCCAASYSVSKSGGHYICVSANAWSSWRCIYDQVAIYEQYLS
ncbi:MAG: D-alanyl-D-alanine carboxypeptidase [Butyrivibrio sp.]|nr:D-alanyl-D-alanine carboxypeptidase [Butyrivibrio sp.]